MNWSKIETTNNLKIWSDINFWLERFIPANADFVKNARLTYLKNRRKYLHILSFLVFKAFGLEPEEDHEIKRINSEINRYENPKISTDITEDMIENARNYPIENLIEIKNGFALCPFHNDHNPSAYCKNNYLYCFSCGTHADTIKLYMHLHNCDFKEAVNQLN